MPAESESGLVSPYSADDKARILGSVLWKPGVDQEKLFRQIELGATKCVYLRQAQRDRPDLPLSKQEEYWDSVASILTTARQRLEEILADPHRYIEIETAIANRPHARSRRSSSAEIPRFDPPAGHVWTPPLGPPSVIPSGAPMGESIPDSLREILLRAQDGIAQAEALIEETVLFASEEKTSRRKDGMRPGERAAGRTADKPLYTFVALISSQYWKHAARPRVPAIDRANPEKGTELVVLLDACLRPIGISYDGHAGIVSLWHRVRNCMPRGWPKSERQ